MTSLSALQQDFQAYLLGKNKAFEQAVTGPNSTFAKQRLAIYSEAYRLRLVDILKMDFPCLRLWLGDTAFERLGLNYLDRYPSKFFSAREFGRYMAAYLATTEPHNKNSFLTEFAQFERALSETIDSLNANIVTIEDIIAIPPESWPTMRFTLHPAVTSHLLHWNIPDIRKILIEDEIKIARKRFKRPTSWLMWRNNIDVKYKELDEKESFTLKAFAQGMTFEEICQDLMEWLSEEEAAQYIVQFLQRWIPEQIFSTVSLA